MRKAAVAPCLVLAAVLSAQVNQPAPRKGGDGGAAVDRFLHNRPFTLQEILIAAGSVAPQRLRTAIENRGVDFEATSATLDQLKAAGATADILDLIKRVAPVPKPPPPPPQPPPPPPPPPKKGSLTVECDPPECEISVNGKPRGKTVEGKLIVPELLVGKYYIDITRSGYLSNQVSAVVEPDKTAHASVRLTPDSRTRELLGARLMVRMLEAMGGDAAFKKAERITANGTLTLSDPAGRQSEWALVAHLTPPHAVFLDKMKSGNTSAWITIEGETAPRTSRKFEQMPEAAGIQHAARMLRNLQPFALIGRIERDKTRLLAADPKVLTFRAEIDSDAYLITVSQDFLPLRIQYQPAAAREPTMEVLYSGYDTKASVHYPTDIRIRGAGRPLVISFHFDSVSFDPTLNRK